MWVCADYQVSYQLSLILGSPVFFEGQFPQLYFKTGHSLNKCHRNHLHPLTKLNSALKSL